MPLQKSHSEGAGYTRRQQQQQQQQGQQQQQQNGQQHHQQWQRSKSHGIQPQWQQQPPRQFQTSNTTKNKLLQFHFQPSPTLPSETEQADAPDDRTAATPKTRLSWRELGSPSRPGDQDAHVSPNDRITWVNCQDGYAALTPGPRRLKRARSSSPASSPANDAAGVATPPVDLKMLAQALRAKTPHADPTLELWDRLTLAGSGSGGKDNGNGNANGGGGAGASSNVATPLVGANPALAQLVASSSPRPKNPEGGLRRSISCGLNWPKRRRTERYDSPLAAIGVKDQDENSPKTTLVTALLDKVTSSIQDTDVAPVSEPSLGPALKQDLPLMKPSPSPNKRRVASWQSPRRPSSRSQSQQSQAAFAKLAPIEETHAITEGVATACVAAGPQDGAGSESDYGDDDFDVGTYLELEATLEIAPSTASAQRVLPTTSVQPVALVRGCSRDDNDSYDDMFNVDDGMLEPAEEDILLMASRPPEIQPRGRRSELEDTGALRTTNGALMAAAAAVVTEENAGVELDDDEYFEDDDDFGDDFDVDAAVTATQTALPTTGRPESSFPATGQKLKVIQRYLIKEVAESEYNNAKGQTRLSKILVVKADGSDDIKMVHLRDNWSDTPAHVGSYVHVIGDFINDTVVVDDEKNLLILHPDQLISSTVLADSFTCMRRAVLQDRVKAASELSAPLVYGKILHEIFQAALKANRWDRPFLGELIEAAMSRYVEDLYVIKIGKHLAREHLQARMTELSHWARAFVAAQPRADAVVHDRGSKTATMCVSKLLDVEEHVWSPKYGLKGNIDATVQVTIRDGADDRVLTVPFELKTGKNINTSHTAQTMLYTLLLSDRYDIKVAYGVLYYMESSHTMRLPAIRNELLQIIMQRNRLAVHATERSARMPEMRRNKDLCGRCYAQTSCFVYHRLADGGDGETSGLGARFDEKVAHLTDRHRDFFLQWERLLTTEEKESQQWKRELWTMTGAERERKGRCFAGVVIEPGSGGEDHDGDKINRFRYTFVKQAATTSLPAKFSFLESQLGAGDPVVVSDEEGHFALAVGYVTAVGRRHISIAVDRRLHNSRQRQDGFDEEVNQVFGGIMEVEAGVKVKTAATAVTFKSSSSVLSDEWLESAAVTYRLDKDEFSTGMAAVRNNLVQVMATDDVRGATRIRRLVVDLDTPRFTAVAGGQATQRAIATVAGNGGLNVDQRAAIEKVMAAQDYALVLGMPGTGKTTTIAHIIRALTAQGKSVLLTSYTHSAVDNILLKLREDEIPIIRLGSAAKVHADVRTFVTLISSHSTFTDPDQVHDVWHGSPVVATTCLGVTHQILVERRFDYCIVDEASQITLPVCLGPIRAADRFVLVGDHNQLPPLVRNEEARRGGLDVSLFKLLSDAHPESVVNLAHQYRMCEDIMALSNELVYGGRLRCGAESLRKRAIHIPDLDDGLRRVHYQPTHHGRHHHHHHHHNGHDMIIDSAFTTATADASIPRGCCPGPDPVRCWIRRLLDPEVRVCFVNTDTMAPAAREESRGNLVVNPAEARIVVQLVEGLLAGGAAETDVGVITPYRSQLSLLRHGMRARRAVELDTTDRFQGRDKEAVVLSLVRSNEGGSIGELLRDWRRINVAFTRAKTKLLVVGSRETLRGGGCDGSDRGGEMINRFVALMERRDWVFNLPAGALDDHDFVEAATQITAASARVTSPRKRTRATPSSVAAKRREAGGGAGAGAMPPSPCPAPKRKARVGEKVILGGKPILRDILNEMTDGQY